MNTKLVKILALSAVALSLGACGKKPTSQSEAPKAQEATIEEILEINADGKFALEGKLVSVDDLTIGGKYGNTFIGCTAIGETTDTLRGLQIDVKELPAFQKGSGWRCLISATGTLANVEGRAVLKDAEVTIKSEAEYDDKGNPVDGTGGDLYYWGKFSRAAFDNYIGRKMSGIMTEGVYQIASMPGTVSGTAGSTFQVVFPGEYADVEDPDNISLITVQIPAGVNEAGVKGINEYFAKKKVGDFIDMTAYTQYDLANNGGAGLLVESFMGQQLAEPNPVPVVYTTWQQVADIAQDYYADPLPTMTSTKPFTYKVDVSSVNKPISELFDDASWIALTDINNAVFVDFSLIAKPNEIYDTTLESDLFREVTADFVAAGFAKDAAQSEEGAEAYTLTIGQRVVAEAVVLARSGYVEIYYMADKLVLEANNFAGIKAAYETRASKRLGAAFTSGLVDAATAGNKYTLDVKYETYYKEKYKDDLYEYSILISYETLPEGLEEAYETALLAAGFEAKLLKSYNAKGFYNATSKEFVVDFTADANDKMFGVNVYVFGPTYPVDEDVVEIPDSIDTFAGAVAAYEEVANAAIGTITGTAGTLGSALVGPAQEIATYTINDSAATNFASYYAQLGLIVQVGIVGEWLDSVTDLQAALDSLVAAIKGAGFVEKNLSLFDEDGLYNATTNEFVIIQANTSMFMITVFVLDAKTAAYVTDVTPAQA